MTFIDSAELFVYGFIMGYFCNPVYNILKKIVSEARIASEQWSKHDRH